MSRCRFVMPETVRLTISDGDWIEVKKDLNVGEQKQLESCGIKRTLGDRPELDWVAYHVGRVAIWVVDWSFKGPDDRPVKLSYDAIKSLDDETFQEVSAALEKHIEELNESKKAKALATTV